MERHAPADILLLAQARAAVVIGGSAGAFETLQVLLAAIPRTVRVPIIVVVHLPPNRPSSLASVLRSSSSLELKEAEDKEPLSPGTVYFAPPDYHLLVEAPFALALSADEPVKHSRPSIDVLFESAADVFQERLLAILLSGASDDGAAGLKAIRMAGGATVVQDPQSTRHALMPSAAIRVCPPSSVLNLEQLTALCAAFPAVQESGPLRRDE